MAGDLILVVDDEGGIVQLARAYLERDGFAVESACDGEEALRKANALKPALIVLDLMLPKVDGWEVCRRIRARSQVPIIMLTARSDDVDKIVGLALGADDYLTKPFNPHELVARVRAVLRRVQRPADSGEPIRIGDLAIDPRSREVTVRGERVEMRTKEFDVLLVLAQHKGLVVTREQLLSQAWGYDFYGETRTVDVHVAHVRDKIRSSSVVIETVWGIGYKLVEVSNPT
ncbi:MAG: response regulator transcription factor [Anaerolineae bacterium]|nr:response regulator transcription factor [Anaerolineae bacterium]